MAVKIQYRRNRKPCSGQLSLNFGRATTRRGKVKLQDFDPKIHKPSDIDLRTLPRKRIVHIAFSVRNDQCHG